MRSGISTREKVARSLCLGIWKRRKLDAQADDVIAGVRRWNGSDQWQRGIIPNPSTFLNQERWKDTPPAPEPKPLAKGEVRVRETTEEEKREAEQRKKFFELSKLHPGKSEAEIAAMMQS